MAQPHASSVPTPAQRATEVVTLPASVESFVRKGEARRIDAAEIFDYMDGAGELYVAYRFDHLEVSEYRAVQEEEILVEVYFMQGSDDAFGLLSGDWGGEAVTLGSAVPGASSGEADGWSRALYGAGLLRVWSDNLYARIMAVRESDASRRAVHAIGRAIVSGRTPGRQPRLVAAVPDTVGEYSRRRESTCFLRSHLVLNSAYFLAQQNILSLGHDVDALTVHYDPTPGTPGIGRPRLVLVRYPEHQRARQALVRFRQTYLPETQRALGIGEPAMVHIEDGWAACQVRDRALAVALECPDAQVASMFVTAGLAAVAAAEDSHD